MGSVVILKDILYLDLDFLADRLSHNFSYFEFQKHKHKHSEACQRWFRADIPAHKWACRSKPSKTGGCLGLSEGLDCGFFKINI
jgi:hypothetical protein